MFIGTSLAGDRLCKIVLARTLALTLTLTLSFTRTRPSHLARQTVDWPANIDPDFGTRWRWQRELLESDDGSDDLAVAAADAITPNPANETEGVQAVFNGSGGILKGRRHRIFFDQFRGESVELEAGGMCRLPKDARPFRYG